MLLTTKSHTHVYSLLILGHVMYTSKLMLLILTPRILCQSYSFAHVTVMSHTWHLDVTIYSQFTLRSLHLINCAYSLKFLISKSYPLTPLLSTRKGDLQCLHVIHTSWLLITGCYVSPSPLTLLLTPLIYALSSPFIHTYQPNTRCCFTPFINVHSLQVSVPLGYASLRGMGHCTLKKVCTMC